MEIGSYTVAVFGGPDGVGFGSTQRMRTNLKLYSTTGSTAGWIRFVDSGMHLPADTQDGRGYVTMHLPTAMLAPTIDVLRNEKPLHLKFTGGSGVLKTGPEEIGEGEAG